MKLRMLSTTIAIAAATAVSAIAAPASADPRNPYRSDSTEMRPNADLIASGLFTLAIPYVASVAVATQSPREADHFLYTPVAGPWLDLSHRDDCPKVGSCSNETAFKILLVADGVLQGFGALEILSGFLFPEPQSVKTDSSPRVRVVPSVAGGGPGVTALGRF
jgi:hypothetical protein